MTPIDKEDYVEPRCLLCEEPYGAQIEGEFATCAEGLEWLKSHGLLKS